MDSHEEGRASCVKTYRERAQARYEAIFDYLTDEFERKFDCSRRPEKLITAPAPTEGKPLQNPDRLFLWYCTYRVHGNRLESLMPSYADNGKWDRSKRPADAPRLGRPTTREGAPIGHSAIGLEEMIENSFVRWSAMGKPMTETHRDALMHDFGCRVEKLSDGTRRLYHPEGARFPSYQSYRKGVIKIFGIEAVQRRRFSDERYRSRLAVPTGSYSRECANYCERTEADCYYVKERPTQLLSSEPGARLAVCRIVCTTSGMKTGIGFSYGAEKAEAYRLAKFCAAIPKSIFGRLFMLEISDDDDWPGSGLAPRDIFDRGPGSSDTVSGSDDVAPATSEIAQSYSGQAKATVEASHPRSTKLEGAPTFVQSDLNPFQLAKREVMRTIAQNHATQASGRLTPSMMIDGVAGNPAAIAKYLIARGRTDATPVSYEQAVREFLTPVKFQLKDDGLWLDGMPFSHTHLVGHGLPNRVPKGQHVKISGYMYAFSVCLGWVEVKGRIFEVQPILRIRDSNEQFCMTLDDLGRISQRLRDLRANQRDHATATMADAAWQFMRETGMLWNAGSRRFGKPPPLSQQREELPMTQSKSAAKGKSR